MITKDNFSEIISNSDLNKIRKVLNKPHDCILMELHVSNAGSFATYKSKDYSEKRERKANLNGDLFCDKDNFKRLIEEAPEHQLNWIAKAVIFDEYIEIYVDGITLSFLANEDPSGFGYGETGNSREIAEKVQDKIYTILDFFIDTLEKYERTHIVFPDESCGFGRDSIFGLDCERFLIKIYYEE